MKPKGLVAMPEPARSAQTTSTALRVSSPHWVDAPSGMPMLLVLPSLGRLGGGMTMPKGLVAMPVPPFNTT